VLLFIRSLGRCSTPEFLFQIQYMILLPSFTNVLLIYSMCNLHDVSWGESFTAFVLVLQAAHERFLLFTGTKGSTTTHDLGAAKASKKDGKDVVESVLSTPSPRFVR
jgi:chitin synthase